MNHLRWLVTIPVAIVVVIFAVNNRGEVNVSLWPLDLVIAWPIFVFVFIGAGVGFVLGAILMWFTASRVRARCGSRSRPLRKHAPARSLATGADGLIETCKPSTRQQLTICSTPPAWWRRCMRHSGTGP